MKWEINSCNVMLRSKRTVHPLNNSRSFSCWAPERCFMDLITSNEKIKISGRWKNWIFGHSSTTSLQNYFLFSLTYSLIHQKGWLSNMAMVCASGMFTPPSLLFTWAAEIHPCPITFPTASEWSPDVHFEDTSPRQSGEITAAYHNGVSGADLAA